jgi:hypothetical protein
MGEEHKLCAKSPPKSKCEKSAAFVRESFMLETRGSSNLVNILNSVCSLKENWIPLSAFLEEQYHLCAESPLSMKEVKGRRNAALVREALMFQARGPCTLLSILN